MPRPPSRPTLKLPAKSTSGDAAGKPRSPLRRPVRSGATPAKPSLAEVTRRRAERPLPPPAAPTKAQTVAPAPAGRGEPRVRPPAPAKKVTTMRTEPTEAAPAKVYPKRGIARSTGARALPPVVRRDEPRPATPAPSARNQAVSPVLSEAPSADATRRPLKEPPRLAKRLCDMTQCSRREADEWIENGWVRVDGVVVSTLGTRAHPGAKIEISPEASKHQTEYVTILINKPADSDMDTVGAVALISPENRWKEDDTAISFKATHLRGMALAGRLDASSTGMLVLTQEGSVARRITGDETRLEKEYLVRVEGELSPADLKRLNVGLTLDEIKLKRAQVSWQHEGTLRFVLHESRKDQIRRMCELVGLRVTEVKRIRIGSVSLGKLPVGQWRYLRLSERF